MKGKDTRTGYIVINSRGMAGRGVLAVVVLLVAAFTWFAVRNLLGNMLAELTPTTQPDSGEIAAVALRMAPSDPTTRWLAASKQRDTFTDESIDRSVLMFEDVVRSSPYDFRWWIELGRAYEQAERPERAEPAFLRSLELAPSYTFPHWQYGNFLLRQGRSDEAFAELTKATEKSVLFREQVFSLAWDYFDKDPAMVEKYAADTPDVRVGLARFYAERDSPKNALRIWNTIPEDARASNEATGRAIAQRLYDKRYFAESIEFARLVGFDPDAKYGVVTNGGFEKPLVPPDESLFGWKIARNDSKADIVVDANVKQEGNRSLRVSFRNYAKRDFYNITQVVPADAGASYQLSFSVRTENLRTGGPPLVEVTDCRSERVLSASEPFTLGTSDWSRASVQFTVPDDCSAVIVRTARLFCGEECPINGTFWYDDFTLTKQ